MLKKLLNSKWLRILFSLVLIYFAFRKVKIVNILAEMALVPKWFVVAMVVYLVVAMIIGGVRWTMLLIEKPKMADFWNFTRASYLGAFYSLFFPTMVAGDVLKWIPLLEKYPELSKTRLASSVLIDRVIGLSAFALMGWLSLAIGKRLNYQFPDYLWWLFSLLALGVAVFYVMVYTIDFDKIFGKLAKKFGIVNKLLEVVYLLKNENKKRIFYCFLLSIVVEPIWILPVWFYSLIFGVGISLLQVYIFVPVINLILVLPISVAGFGARENMFLFFFSQLGFVDEKVLLISTFAGLMNVVNSLIGGLLMLLK